MCVGQVIYLKNVVAADELGDDTQYNEICVDIRLEAEKFGPVTSIEVPRPGHGPGGEKGGAKNAITGGALAITDGSAGGDKPKAAVVPDLSMAIVPVGGAKAPVVPSAGSLAGQGSGALDNGVGYAFIEFATIEGASKAKKALSGRRFGDNLVEAEYFSETKYLARDFTKPTPNTEEPLREPGNELVLFGGAGALDEAPVMVE
eukprot:TRINITY_DN1050_c0_g2_i2.p1 TRINITY_DN1050_c0_g2~~TRINITY_DN1050_c0_g2_i2.p1  ORF type:complete len:203 (-),score=65.18 TRINITY_DN1050_c0_g2_i2:186-794(-)